MGNVKMEMTDAPTISTPTTSTTTTSTATTTTTTTTTTSTPAAPNNSVSTPLEGESDAVHIIEAPVKLPPCDQCRRRKVKCDGRRIPCERCTHSRLTCTRDIARKKRGPKKGSGSVIAKLRDEHEYAVLQETGLPAFDLSTLDRQVPALRRSYSNETSFSSPVLSPLAPSLSDVFAPTIETSAIPRSVPTRDSPNGTPYNTDSAPTAGFGQAGIHFPASWQVTPSDLLQFKAPTSPAGYMTVTDLAQQIFQDPFPPPAATHAQSAGHTLPQNIHSGSPKTESAPHRPPSINKVIASPTSSPGSSNGGNYLYRSDSGLVQLGPALVSLAQEVGMSAFLLWQCIKQYFRHVYAIRPFIHEPTFMARLNQSEDLSIEEKVLVLSLCAVTAVHDAPETEALSLEKKLKLGNQLLETAIQMRKSYGWIEHATVLAIQTSYLIAVALFELKKPRSHHFYLREAIGMAYDQNLHKELGYVNMSEIQAICARRTFAVLFITERGFAILRNKPASITKLPIVPTEYFDEQDRLVLAGFTAIVNLFSVLDENFVNLWRSEPGDELSSTPLDNIASLQHSLNEIEFDAYSLTPVQRADVYITHQWLRLIFWQASMRLGLVSSDATDPIFYYNYPIIVARDTCIVMKQLTPEAILVHGLGIFEKIFEITYTLMDALTIAKIAWSDSPELRKLFEVLAASPNSQNTYVKMLQSKFDVQSPDATTPGVKDQASYASPQYCSPPDESSQEQGAWKPPIWTTFEPEGKPVDYGKGDLNQRGISTDFIMADVSKPLDS